MQQVKHNYELQIVKLRLRSGVACRDLAAPIAPICFRPKHALRY